MALSGMKPKLIEDWKRAWKLLSVQLNTLGIVLTIVVEFLNSIWYSLPPHVVEKIPNSSTVALVFFVLSIVGRLLKQRKSEDGSK
jgi:hypothetical protein